MSIAFIIPGLCIFGALILLLFAARSSLATFTGMLTDWARNRLEEAFVFVDPGPWVRVAVAATAFVPLIVWWIAGGGLAFLTFLALVIGPFVGFSVRKSRRRARIVQQLPDMLLMLSSSLRAGTSLQVAMDIAIREMPAELSQEMSVVVREQRLGLALEDALETFATRLKLEEVDLIVSAMTIARDVGGNLAEILDQLSRTLRAKAVMEGKIRALTSQGKLQGLVVGSLPVALMFALSYMQPEAMAPLFNTLLGYLVLAVIAAAETVGFFWIRKIVTIDV